MSRKGNLLTCLDATGSIVKKPEHEKKRAYYYALLLPGDADHSAIPIAEFISCSHDALRIQRFLISVKTALGQVANSTTPVIDKLEQDFSLAGLHAASLAFNGLDLHKYIQERFDDFMNPGMALRFYTTLHVCGNHCYHNWVKRIRASTADHFTQILLAAACVLLMHATSLEETRAAYRDFIIVFALRYTTSMLESSLERLVNIGLPANNMSEDPNYEEKFIGADPITPESLAYKITSPFAQFFKREYESVMEEASRTSYYDQPNPYQTENFIQYFHDEYLPYFVLWSGIDIKKFNLRRDSNATAENWFKLLKHDELKGKEKELIPRFIQNQEKIIERRLASWQSSTLTTRQRRTRKRKVTLSVKKSVGTDRVKKMPVKKLVGTDEVEKMPVEKSLETDEVQKDLNLCEEYWDRKNKMKSRRKIGLSGIMKKIPKYVIPLLHTDISQNTQHEESCESILGRNNRKEEKIHEEDTQQVLQQEIKGQKTAMSQESDFARNQNPDSTNFLPNDSREQPHDSEISHLEVAEPTCENPTTRPAEVMEISSTDDESTDKIPRAPRPASPNLTISSLGMPDLLPPEHSDYKPWIQCNDYPENWQKGSTLNVGGVTVHRGAQNFSTLKPNEEINDAILNGFLSVMWQLYPQGPAVFDSFFPPAILSSQQFNYGYLIFGLQAQLWKKQSWVIPVNTKNLHWSLLLINFFERKMIYLDSARFDPDKVLINGICHYIEILFELAGVTVPNWRHWKLQRPVDVPYQFENHVGSRNCGIHCCVWAYVIFSSAVIEFNETDMANARKWIVTMFLQLDKRMLSSAGHLQCKRPLKSAFHTMQFEARMAKLLQRKPKSHKWAVNIQSPNESTLQNFISLKALMKALEDIAIEIDKRFPRQSKNQ